MKRSKGRPPAFLSLRSASLSQETESDGMKTRRVASPG